MPGRPCGSPSSRLPRRPMWPLESAKTDSRLGEHVEVELGLAQRPRLDGEARVLDHAASQQLGQILTTTSAPCSRSASACRPGRRRRRSRSARPARPRRPASASSKTAACAGSTPRARRAGEERVRRRLARPGAARRRRRRRRRARRGRRSRPTSSTSRGVGAGGDDRAAQPGARDRLGRSATDPRRPRRRRSRSSASTSSFLRLPRPCDGLGARRVVRRALGEVDAARQRGSAPRRRAACRRRTRRSRGRVERPERSSGSARAREEVVEHLLPGGRVDLRRVRSARRRDRRGRR